ncbi:unnamed protein product, partial [Adineta steineri]
VPPGHPRNPGYATRAIPA